MKAKVTEQGVVIPKAFLEEVEEVEIRLVELSGFLERRRRKGVFL